MPTVPGEPTVAEAPNVPLTADLRYSLQNTFNGTLAGSTDLGAFLKALMQKLDNDPGVSATNFELTFTP